jgi:hypothetical protein
VFVCVFVFFLFFSEGRLSNGCFSASMERASVSTNPRTVEEVFKDYKGRRAGMLKALTADVEDFYQQCDPEKENLCLYGFPDEAWEVNLPAEEVPPELPEPALGINFARDGMLRKDWLSLVAVHSDAWLLAVSFYYGARFDKNERKRLFNMINERRYASRNFWYFQLHDCVPS